MTTARSFAIFETAIGPCGIIWGSRGVSGVQLPEGNGRETRTDFYFVRGGRPAA